MIVRGKQYVEVDIDNDTIYHTIKYLLDYDRQICGSYEKDYENGVAVHKNESKYKKIEYTLAMLREFLKIDDLCK